MYVGIISGAQTYFLILVCFECLYQKRFDVCLMKALECLEMSQNHMNQFKRLQNDMEHFISPEQSSKSYLDYKKTSKNASIN